MFKYLSSMGLGLSLIGMLALVSIIATLQPSSSVYSSFLYRGLLFLLCLNISLCTSKRLPQLFKRISNKDLFKNFQKDSFTNSKSTKEPENCLEQIKKSLNQSKFKIFEKTGANFTYIFARKNKWELAAPHIIHISILIIVIGAIIGNFGGVENVQCSVGEVVSLPESISSEYEIKLNDFQTIYDANGDIDNWQSDFTLLKEGESVKEGRTKVNSPFKFKEMKFYQSAYGLNHEVKIKMGSAEETMEFPTNRAIQIAENVFMLFAPKDDTYVLQKYENNHLKEIFELNTEKDIPLIDGLSLSKHKVKPYSVIKIKTDPGLPVVLMGFILMALGFVFSWFGKYQEVKIILEHEQGVIGFSVNTKDKWIKEKLQKVLEKFI